MGSTTEITFEKFVPDKKTSTELERDQTELIAYFEKLEKRLTDLNGSKAKTTHKTEITNLMRDLLEIESLWKKSRQTMFELQNQPYEDMSIIQYRMLVFLEKRKAYREKIESLELKDQAKSEMPQLPVEVAQNESKTALKLQENAKKQLALTDFFPK